MKRVILFLSAVFMAVSVWSQTAQIIEVISEDTMVVTYYDTVVVFHHPDFVSCNKTVWNYRIPDNHFAYGTMEEYYHRLMRYLYEPVDGYDSIYQMPVTYYPFSLDGSFFGKNSYAVEAYGQPFHFDSPVTVIGVAAQVRGDINGLNKNFYITSEADDFKELASAPVFPAALRPGNTRDSRANYFFNTSVTLKDFIIVGETYFNISDTALHFWGDTPMPAPWLNYNATFSVFDTV